MINYLKLLLKTTIIKDTASRTSVTRYNSSIWVKIPWNSKSFLGATSRKI